MRRAPVSRRVSTAIGVFLAVLATTSTAPADDSPTESFWYVPQGNIEQAPRALTPAEEAKRAYETAARNAEEARIANEAGVYYNSTEGLLWAHVRCTPLCGVWRVMVAPGTAAAAIAAPRVAFHGLAAISPHYVGARPEQGLGGRPDIDSEGVLWFSRSVHRRFRCDCAVGLANVSAPSAYFERLDGASELPDDVKYTRGEAFAAALRQLVISDPRPNGEPDEPVVVVSAGNRARLVHRFLFRLNEKPHTVDVDDANLEVVKVLPVRPFVLSGQLLLWGSRR